MLAPALPSMLADDFTLEKAMPIVFACLILIVLVVVAGISVTWLRRWLKASQDLPVGGFSLGDLRALLKQGKISIEEFDRARTMIIGEAKKTSQRPRQAPPPPNSGKPPGLV